MASPGKRHFANRPSVSVYCRSLWISSRKSLLVVTVFAKHKLLYAGGRCIPLTPLPWMCHCGSPRVGSGAV